MRIEHKCQVNHWDVFKRIIYKNNIGRRVTMYG